MTKIKLFCFPFAGGSAAAYNPWKPLLSNNIELRGVELAGRGRRIRESMYQSIPEAVNDVYSIIRDEIATQPYALYGHSMGSVIAFELYYKIKENNLPGPRHIFFSGRGAPHCSREGKKVFHLMPDDEFREEMIKLGGTASEFFEHPELLEVFLPLLKNDLKVNESYEYTEKPSKLECNVTVLNGLQDEDVKVDEVEEWKQHSAEGYRCTIQHFAGGHFFINEEPAKVVDIINRTLTL